MKQEFYNKFKNGDLLTVDMGDGPEQVTVISNSKAGMSGVNLITLKRKVGAPYTITQSRLAKAIVESHKQR
jgi:hypothetical protein